MNRFLFFSFLFFSFFFFFFLFFSFFLFIIPGVALFVWLTVWLLRTGNWCKLSGFLSFACASSFIFLSFFFLFFSFLFFSFFEHPLQGTVSKEDLLS